MPRAHPVTRWDPDPANDDVRRWREDLARGSPTTAEAWFRAFRRFCGTVRRTPTDLLRMKPKAARDLFLDFAESDAKRGRKGSYTAYTIKVAFSWLRFNGVTPPPAPKVKDASAVYEESALTYDQLRTAVSAASPRVKVAIHLMAQSGTRPEVLGDYFGRNGLKLGDFPELLLGREPKFSALPSYVEVRRDLSKASHKYLTFVGSETAGAITDYLRARIRAGEKLDESSPLYAPVVVGRRAKLEEGKRAPFIRTTTIGDDIRSAFRRARLRTRQGKVPRPYVLRTTAAGRFSEAENKGLVSHTYWQFWMGHSGDFESYYSVNRGELLPSTLTEMRRAYRRCEPLLSFQPHTTPDVGDVALRMVVALLGGERALKEKLSELGVKDVLDLTPEQADALAKEVREASRSGAAVPVTSVPPTQEGGPPQRRVASGAELEALLLKGWDPLRDLGNGRVVVQAPLASGLR